PRRSFTTPKPVSTWAKPAARCGGCCNMTKRTILILTLAAVGIAGALAFRSLRAKPDNRILISGNIELTQINIAFKVSGRLIERAVDEGDVVKKGQII